MNDDLKVLITLYAGDCLLKVAVKIKHGLNNFDGWEFWGDKSIANKWKNFLPIHCREYQIVDIEEIYEVEG